MKTNKKIGNDFESEFCEWLSKQGCWVHNFANRAYGQPTDIIAIRGTNAFLIDCKSCEKDYFDLNRIEDNQHDSMDRWQVTVDATSALFAIKFQSDNQIYILPYYKVCDKEPGRLNRTKVAHLGISLEEFAEWIVS